VFEADSISGRAACCLKAKQQARKQGASSRMLMRDSILPDKSVAQLTASLRSGSLTVVSALEDTASKILRHQRRFP
jgi:hypothetical protein